MSSSFWLLGVLSLYEKKTSYKAEQIHKMTTIFSQTGCRISENSCHFVNLLSFTSISFFLILRKIMGLNSQQPKTRGHV